MIRDINNVLACERGAGLPPSNDWQIRYDQRVTEGPMLFLGYDLDAPNGDTLTVRRAPTMDAWKWHIEAGPFHSMTVIEDTADTAWDAMVAGDVAFRSRPPTTTEKP